VIVVAEGCEAAVMGTQSFAEKQKKKKKEKQTKKTRNTGMRELILKNC